MFLMLLWMLGRGSGLFSLLIRVSSKFMYKKLTISLEEEIYYGLKKLLVQEI